ncbi:MAG: zinc ribbon domain-containing protein [Clostridia bacterium]|nr:zinc ribbon domain-containing protein [Clostridia bacterium]
MCIKKNRYPWNKLFSRKRPPVEIEAVYAGPAYYRRRHDPEGPEQKIDAPEDAEQAAAVAAADEPDGPPPAPMRAGDPEMFKCVYAGPDYFARMQPDVLPDEPAPDCVICPHCGAPVPEGSVLCTACGRPLKEE